MIKKFNKPNNLIINNAVFDKDGFLRKVKGKGFAIYIVLTFLENRGGITLTTISFIMKVLQLKSKDRRKVDETLNTLIHEKIIECNTAIDSNISVNEVLYIKMLNPKEKYTLLEIEDFKLIQYLGFNNFAHYCVLKRYYNESLGYSFPKFQDVKKCTGFGDDSI